MKTLLLAPELFTANGGIPRILRSYLKALCDLAGPGDQVRVVALNDVAIDPAALKPYSTNSLVYSTGCAGKKIPFARTALEQALLSTRLICGHVRQSPVAWWAKRKNPQLRYEVIAHGIEVWRRFNFLERLALRQAHRIWCVSDSTRREMMKFISLPAERFVVLPNTLDPFFSIAPGQILAGCDPVIVTVSRLSSADNYKGIDDLIEALPAVRAVVPAARLRIIGQGDDVTRLQALVAKHQLPAASVEFLGFVDDERLGHELSTCRLFALPSRAEGFGLVFLEAMARSRPCLGANAGGIPEIISPETGLMVDYGQIPALATAMIAGLRRPWDEAAIIARAKAFSYPVFRRNLAELLVQ